VMRPGLHGSTRLGAGPHRGGEGAAGAPPSKWFAGATRAVARDPLAPRLQRAYCRPRRTPAVTSLYNRFWYSRARTT
jgi:hypothetical protein